MEWLAVVGVAGVIAWTVIVQVTGQCTCRVCEAKRALGPESPTP